MGMLVKRLQRFVPIALVVALVCYLAASLSPAEPSYEGQPLHYWLAHVHNLRLSTQEQEQARAALACLGTNHLQLLVKWFREPEPPYSEPPLRRLRSWLYAKVHYYPPTTFKFQPSRPAMAYMLFTECPPAAEQAMPEFVAMLADPQDETKAKAATILASIGRPAVPGLLMRLSHTNEVTRALAAWTLGNVGTNVDGLLPWLEPMLEDKAECVRLSAAVAVGNLDGNPKDFVPVILRCLHEGDENMKLSALDCLEKLKARAQLAVPDLTNSLALLTNTALRYATLNALKAIAPEAASQFDEAPTRPEP